MPTVYTGARYVPAFANPIEWNSIYSYEALTIVTYQNNSYTSKKPVPAGVQITNTEYWALTGNYNAQIGDLASQILDVSENVTDLKEEFKDYRISAPNMYNSSSMSEPSQFTLLGKLIQPAGTQYFQGMKVVNGKIYVCAEINDNLKIAVYDLNTLQQENIYDIGSNMHGNSLTYIADKNALLICNASGTLVTFDLETNTVGTTYNYKGNSNYSEMSEFAIQPTYGYALANESNTDNMLLYRYIEGELYLVSAFMLPDRGNSVIQDCDMTDTFFYQLCSGHSNTQFYHNCIRVISPQGYLFKTVYIPDIPWFSEVEGISRVSGENPGFYILDISGNFVFYSTNDGIIGAGYQHSALYKTHTPPFMRITNANRTTRTIGTNNTFDISFKFPLNMLAYREYKDIPIKYMALGRTMQAWLTEGNSLQVNGFLQDTTFGMTYTSVDGVTWTLGTAFVKIEGKTLKAAYTTEDSFNLLNDNLYPKFSGDFYIVGVNHWIYPLEDNATYMSLN